MNREIKFRGISIDEWVYGMLCKVNEGDTEHGEPIKYKIQTEEKEYGEYVQYFITDEKTIGQYTGLHDKNGKEIYEGDIVQIEHKDIKFKGLVKYDETYLAYVIISTNTIKHEFENLGDYLDYDIEVIGNAYDNPELLGGEDE